MKGGLKDPGDLEAVEHLENSVNSRVIDQLNDGHHTFHRKQQEQQSYVSSIVTNVPFSSEVTPTMNTTKLPISSRQDYYCLVHSKIAGHWRGQGDNGNDQGPFTVGKRPVPDFQTPQQNQSLSSLYQRHPNSLLSMLSTYGTPSSHLSRGRGVSQPRTFPARNLNPEAERMDTSLLLKGALEWARFNSKKGGSRESVDRWARQVRGNLLVGMLTQQQLQVLYEVRFPGVVHSAARGLFFVLPENVNLRRDRETPVSILTKPSRDSTTDSQLHQPDCNKQAVPSTKPFTKTTQDRSTQSLKAETLDSESLLEVAKETQFRSRKKASFGTKKLDLKEAPARKKTTSKRIRPHKEGQWLSATEIWKRESML